MRPKSSPARTRLARTFLCLLAAAGLAAFAAGAGASSASPADPPSNCAAPGLEVSTDAAGDQFGTEAGLNQPQDLLSTSLAEEYDSFGRGTLVATMKVAALDPNALPRNGKWITYFTATHADQTTTTYYLSADTNELGQIAYNYGFVDGSINSTQGDADGGTLSAGAKTITVRLALEKVKQPAGTPAALTGPNVDFSAGKSVSGVRSETVILLGASQAGGLLQEVDATEGGGYSFAGAAACAPAATPTPTPQPTPTPGGGGDPAACAPPPTVLRADPAGDQTGNPLANQKLDIQSLSVAEDYKFLNHEKLVFGMKVATLAAPLPPNGVWRTVFTDGGGSFYVSLNTDPGGVPYYEYGSVGGSLVTPLGAPDEGSFTPDGNIRIAVAASKVGNPQGGSALTAVSGRTQQFVGVAGTGAFANVDSTAPEATYAVAGRPAACAPTAQPSGATYLKGGITFSPNVALHAPATVRDGEPSLRVDRYGNAYVAAIRGVPAGNDLWYVDLRPRVGGQPNPNYDPFMRRPLYRGQPDAFTGESQPSLLADGGGDVDLAVSFPDSETEDPNNPPALAFTSLALANVSTAVSKDRGVTFQKNPAGNVTGGVPLDDRQWFEAVGPNTVYLLYRTLAPAVTQIQRSTDGGLTWGVARTAGAIGQVGSVDVHKATGTVYVSGSTGQVCVGEPLSPLDEPLTYTCKQAAPANANLFFVVKVADDGTPNGTVYVNYSDGRSIFIAYSTDKGQTWSQPVRVNDGPETRTALLPWMETGPVPGSLGVVWYGTDHASNNNDANWKVFFAQVTGANTPAPVIRQAVASDHVIHASNISLSGLSPTATNVNRNLIDYFQVAFDPTGAAVIAYTDDHNDFDGNTYVTRQISGPSVAGGEVPAPVEGSALPAPTPYSADGAQVTDPARDARTSTAILRVDEAVDITSIKYSTEGAASDPVLVAQVKVSDLSVVPPASFWRVNFAANAPDSVLSPTGGFSFGVADRGDQFWLAAQTDATGAKSYRFGTAARNGNGGIDYTDRGAADFGSIDPATHTITLKVSVGKLNPFVGAGRPPVGLGTVLTGLRGQAVAVSAQGNNARSDSTRGGTQYVIGLPRFNVALAANGASVTASSTYPAAGFAAPAAIDGDRTGAAWGAGGGWADATRGLFPDTLEVNFGGRRTVDEVRVYTLQDNYAAGGEPNAATPATTYGLVDFEVQAWDGSAWVTVPGGAVTGNDRALRTFNFSPVTATRLRVLVHNARAFYSRVVEVEAFGVAAP